MTSLQAKEVYDQLSPQPQGCCDLAQEKVSLSWLTVLQLD